MNLTRMMTDKVFFEDKNGIRSGPYKSRFGTDRITVFQDELNVTEGDRVIQSLPDGTEQIYIAGAITYNAGRRNIPGHFSIAITREAASPAPGMSAAGTGTDIHRAGARAGNTSIENIAASLQSLAKSIENTDFPAEQKDEAERLLRSLIAHPVVAAVLRGAHRPPQPACGGFREIGPER